jgi:hypothetical protein
MQHNKVAFVHFSSYHSSIYSFIQTLIELYLYDNKIRIQGIEYLANALQQNKVLYIQLSSHSFFYLLVYTDTHNS